MTAAKRTGKAALAKPGSSRAPARKKDTRKLLGRFALDFAALRVDQADRAGMQPVAPAAAVAAGAAMRAAGATPAELRLHALATRKAGPTAVAAARAMAPAAPIAPSGPNWTPLGPLAVPDGQTYGGAKVLISGRVTAIAPHPVDGNTIYIGTSRGGIWRTRDGGNTWSALGDDQPSLAIGALAIAAGTPDVLYAGTGEGNVQFYSTAFATSSAPGVYLGVGVLRSSDGGDSWTHSAAALLAGHSFYRIVVDRGDANRAFAATSRGLCRTLDGSTWTELSGGGLPAITLHSAPNPVIACTDVMIDRADSSGNTVYAAFWGSGIYKSTNALAANPSFTLLTRGLPAGNTTSRISLKQSASSPAHKYALAASNSDTFLGLYRTSNAAGTSWELCTSSGTIGLYGAFTSDLEVDPTTPDTVFIAGVELYRCRRNAITGAWSVSNVGSNIHPDSHAVAFHPTLNQTVYSGNDGGFYITRDGGATWEDSPNEGLCLLQYEAIDHHPSSDALVQGGTQDNGTQQYRNSPVHYHSADGDGGYCVVSKIDPRHVAHSYYGNSPQRSITGGAFGSYTPVSTGINGGGLFYPPAAISPTSERMAWATSVVNFDDAMGAGGWPGSGVSLPGLVGAVSAVSFASDSLAHCATTSGQVYRVSLSGGTWTARALHAAPLPVGQWIWDVHTLPGDTNTVIVAFSGFGLAQHVWRGTVPAAGSATWTAVSTGLPDVPMYALAFASATQWFVGTDIGVYRSIDGGASWSNGSQGLPNTAVYDLRLRPGSNLLRAATHGRGLWELRVDLTTQPLVDLFVRDHPMDTGRPTGGAGARAAWADPTRQIALNDELAWWQCADIKTDAPPAWQLPMADANYLEFETRLVHESPEKGNANRVYVQVHNRGPNAASNVTVKLMAAGASAGLPDLPADFWTAWPHSAGNADWTPVGAAQTIATLEPLRPTVLRWDWTPAASADSHSCMLVVVDSPSDPVPATSKAIFNVAQLVTSEKRAGLKNLHLVNLLPDATRPLMLRLAGSAALKSSYRLQVPALAHPQLKWSLLLTRKLSEKLGTTLPAGLKASKLAAKDLAALKRFWLSTEMRDDRFWEQFTATFDTTRQFTVSATVKGVELPLSLKTGQREGVVIVVRSGDLKRQGGGPMASLTLRQSDSRGVVIGGSTFVFRPTKAA